MHSRILNFYNDETREIRLPVQCLGYIDTDANFLSENLFPTLFLLLFFTSVENCK